MADIKTPFGMVPKWALYTGLGVGGLAAVYVYEKKKATKAAQTATPSNAANGAGYAYGYGSQYAYGSASGQYGYGAYTYDAYGYGSGAVGAGAYGSPYGYGSFGSGISTVGATQVTTNAEWTQAALSQLTTQGYTGESVLTALGAYTTGQDVSAAEQPVVSAAIAVEGYPPVEGTNGYPPGIKTTTATTGGGAGGGQASKVTVPDVKGETQEDAFRAIYLAGLKPVGSPGVKGKTLTVQSSNPPSGASVAKGTSVKLTSKVVK
jgi:hypothetical protein